MKVNVLRRRIAGLIVVDLVIGLVVIAVRTAVVLQQGRVDRATYTVFYLALGVVQWLYLQYAFGGNISYRRLQIAWGVNFISVILAAVWIS